MIHIALHFIVPLVVALVVYRRRWRNAAVIMVATMVVDLDHLLANPIYDPERCSIGFHPLHTLPAIVAYAALCILPLAARGAGVNGWDTSTARIVHLIGMGLMIHMVLDWMDCLI